MYAKRAEIKVGIVVILASVALLVLLFYATQGMFWGDYRYVHLRLETGSLAPREGDRIEVNGVEVGSVVDVEMRTETRSGEELTLLDRTRIEAARRRGEERDDVAREIYVHVVAKIKADRVLPVGTTGEIREGVTESRSLRLVLGISPVDLSDEDTLSNPILVVQAPGLDTIAAQVESLASKATTAVDTADEAMVEIKALVQLLQTQIEEGGIERILSDVGEATASLKRTVAALEVNLGSATDDLTAGMADFKRLAASIAKLATGLEDEVPAAIADVRGVVAKLGSILDTAAPKVDLFLDDMNRTGKNLVALSDDFSGIGDEVRDVVEELGVDLDTLADVLTDTGRNLLDASEDLRAHPWKLINEPSPDEIAYENLRTTMQNYVRAMHDMHTTAQTLREVLARGDTQDPTVQALLQRTLARFERSADRYRSSERRLMELLQKEAPVRDGARPPAPGPR